MQTNNYEALQIKAGITKKVEDSLVVEAALQININNEPYTVVMRTPDHDEELIRGLLYAEDIYKNQKKLKLDLIESSENGFFVVNATIPKSKLGKGYLNKRTLLSVSSCGICGKQKLEDIKLNGNLLSNNTSIATLDLKAMFNTMRKAQTVFHKTGGSHAAAIFDAQKEILVLREDIGRHNAVDKAVGSLLNSENLNNAEILLVSGRVSYEIISKAFIAKIPMIAAVSACSSLAVDFAKEFGIRLIGFSRNKDAMVYANP
ncbi:MAG: formate dehydrogenase accessory sulfurtransferase FdhD [Aureibaculum sp.]